MPSDAGPTEALRGAVADAAGSLRGNGEAPASSLERPPRAEFGDYSSNAAMLLAPALKAPPREVAERLGAELKESMGDALTRVDVAGPGFVNLFLSDNWFLSSLQAIRDAGERFGVDLVPEASRERVLIEFVSANPTGPLTVASARGAALGDSVARVLAFVGHEVEREYYVNDYGTQVELFAASIAAAMTGAEVPEDGYRGEYVGELAKLLQDESLGPDDLEAIARRAVELMLDQVRVSLERFRVHFDRWFSEREANERGEVERALAQLEQEGHVYSSEGATWLRTSSFGDDKDRVLRRSTGQLTYFGSDIGYHNDKLSRGYDRLINVVGADHHGYVPRIKAAYQALGGGPDALEGLIMQLVHVVERGERAQMSKRKGEFVTLDDLIDDIGVDAARFFMLQRSHDTPLDIDLDLARAQSQENPVYYVQYAHARIESILVNAGPERVASAERVDLSSLSVLLHPAERTLIKRLLELPDELLEVTERRAPHHLTVYAHEVASDFHAFYRDCRVVGAESPELENLRIALCVACKGVIARSLDLLGVEAPEQM